MQRDGQPEKASIEKKKADDADKCFAVFEIDFGSRRNERRDDLWIDNEVEHGEVSPVGGEKWTHAETLARLTGGHRPSLQF